MLILILFAFLAGIVTVLSPCILPILPIVLSSSLTGGKKRPLGIVTGFICSFTFFTLLLSSIVKATGIGSESLRYSAIVIIGLFGASLLIPATQTLLERVFSRLSSLVPTAKNSQDSGFLGGIIVGLSLGLLWTPCVGPILASVITLALTGTTNASAFFITLAYSIGTALPMLAITYGGRTLLQRNQWLLQNTAKIQKAFGVIMIAMAVALFFGIDRKLQTIILTAFPQYGSGLTSIENNRFVQDQLQKVGGNSSLSTIKNVLSTETLPDLGAAPNPDFSGATKWLNSEPLSLNTNLKGKVVLVDFWTYSCINCIRTLPYITDWYSKYKDKGLVIIGLHAPEFEFEKVETNVRKAMQDFKIAYPVVQDNDFQIWRSYSNQYWPAHYLIDAKGHIRATHFGEGAYAETEKQIQVLLKEAGEQVDMPVGKDSPTPLLSIGARISPETYLGADRGRAYTNTQSPFPSQNVDKTVRYRFQGRLSSDEVGISGDWKVEKERITSASDESTLTMHVHAGKVFLVLGGKNADAKPVKVKMDGQAIPETYQTVDFKSGVITIDMDRKYDILDTHAGVEDHVVELSVPSGISAYAFTFGE